MKLINPNGTISAMEFTCKVTGDTYKLIATVNNHSGDNFSDSVWKSSDIVKRLSDEKRKKFTREEMNERFKDIKL